MKELGTDHSQDQRMNGESSLYRIPSALTKKRRRAPIPTIVGPFGRPEEKAEYLGVLLQEV